MAKIALQMYSIREECQKDFLGTLRRVAAMGYDGAEFAGYFGVPAADVKAVLDETGLEAAGAHVNIKLIEEDLENSIAYTKALGCPAFICPSFRVNKEDPASTFNYIADLFNKTAKRCADEGLQFQYHIHGHEFIDVNGTTGMQMILDQTDPSLVFFEPDTMWIDHAGVDSVQFLRDNAERCVYIHLKDFKDRETWGDTEIGRGQLNIPAMIEIANAHNMPWFVIEQEGFDMPMMESVEISLKNLRAMNQ